MSSKEATDLLQNKKLQLLLWGVPQLIFILGFFLPSSPRAILWFLSLFALGIACLVNAMRCQRLHCFLTGPFYILTALLVGILVVSFNDFWTEWAIGLGLAIIIIGNLLSYFPERIWGKYKS
ncbi:hypothetical protein GWN26_10500 [Candidatus Saccharibacteria bacterium]|nr:hypothetical protein [Candidatus Saccharibacteria bacterium]NIV04063.1 hypothetical protein [Calditrichia bacterium]NIV72452.1 hypothetical protein [Calditrichia bacterium]NIV99528.1 hypothetical protein [Candidatus Saccharibacteria bacterium]NIW79829.1 hypothetical protein [Calditrichia bacterium]